MRLKRSISLLVAVILMCSGLVACGTDDSNSTQTPSENTTNAPGSGSVTQSADSRSVTDQYGNVVEIPYEVKSICGTFPAIDAIVVMLGAGDKMVAATESNQKDEWMLRVRPGIEKLPAPFAEISAGNVEELMQIAPDVIICSSEVEYDVLVSAGLTAVRVNTTSMAGIQDYIALIGEILGGTHAEKSKQLLDYYHANLDRVTSVTDKISEAERPTVFYSAGGTITTEANGSIVKEWIEVGGGINVAAANGVEGMFVDVTPEELMEWDPDIIICRDYATKAEYYDDPTLASLSAVQNDKVFINPYGIFKWCVRSADEAIQPLWAASVIQPELFTDIDMVEECRQFHKEFYGLDLSDAEVDSILFPTR